MTTAILRPIDEDPKKLIERMMRAERLLFHACLEYQGRGRYDDYTYTESAISMLKDNERDMWDEIIGDWIADGKTVDEAVSSTSDFHIFTKEELSDMVRARYEMESAK